jgi:hypothetical protein
MKFSPEKVVAFSTKISAEICPIVFRLLFGLKSFFFTRIPSETPLPVGKEATLWRARISGWAGRDPDGSDGKLQANPR